MSTQTIYDDDSLSSNDGLSSRMSSLQMTPNNNSTTPVKRKSYLPLFTQDSIGYVSPKKRIKLTNVTPNVTQKYASLSSNAFQSFTASSSQKTVESQDSVIVLTPSPLDNDHCYQSDHSKDLIHQVNRYSQTLSCPTQDFPNSISEASPQEIDHQDPSTSESSGKSNSQDNPWAGMTSQDFSIVENDHSQQDSSQQTTISIGDEVDYILTPPCIISIEDGYVPTPFFNTPQSVKDRSVLELLNLPSDSLITRDSVLDLEIYDDLLSNSSSEYDKKLMDLIEKRPPIINNSIKNDCDNITRSEICKKIHEIIWFLEYEDSN